MNDHLNKQLAKALLALAPGFPMDADGIADHIKKQGFDSFIAIADSYDPGLSGAVGLLSACGKEGKQHGDG